MNERRRALAALSAILMLICQPLWGADTKAPDPARWHDLIRIFGTADAACPPSKGGIVFTGSSSIVFWQSIHGDLAPLPVINRGFGGSTMQDAVYWADTLVLKYKPRAVVLYEGDNDIGLFNMTGEQVLEGFQAFVSKVHRELPEARIYFLAIKPSPLRASFWPEMKRANDLIRKYCEQQPKLHFVDVATPMLDGNGQARPELLLADQLHLNDKGYELWTSIVRPVLLERERPAK